MTLLKLKLNLKTTDLFGVSNSVVSRYITTWICFIYHHIKEFEWMPSVDQVEGTLPVAFHEKFPNTLAIIDGSEIFGETQMVQFHKCLYYLLGLYPMWS